MIITAYFVCDYSECQDHWGRHHQLKVWRICVHPMYGGLICVNRTLNLGVISYSEFKEVTLVFRV